MRWAYIRHRSCRQNAGATEEPGSVLASSASIIFLQTLLNLLSGTWISSAFYGSVGVLRGVFVVGF